MHAWKPKRYENGRGFSRRDILPMVAALFICGGAYYVHDVAAWAIPLPSEETMLFIGFVVGILGARRFKP